MEKRCMDVFGTAKTRWDLIALPQVTPCQVVLGLYNLSVV